MHNWALDGKPYDKQLKFPPLTLTRIGEESEQKEHQGVRPSAPSLLLGLSTTRDYQTATPATLRDFGKGVQVFSCEALPE